LKQRIWFLSLAFLALTLSACMAAPQVPPGGTPIALSPTTQGELAAYLARVKATRPGAFAVSPDGRNSFYTWCDDVACMVSNYSILAQRGCQSLSGTPCLVLYVRNHPRFTFTRAADAAPGGQHGDEEQQRIDFDTNR
jgi:hypothetical protein